MIPRPEAKHIPYFIILALLIVVGLQCNSGSKVDPIDTKIGEKQALIETQRAVIETLTKEKKIRDSRIEDLNDKLAVQKTDTVFIKVKYDETRNTVLSLGVDESVSYIARRLAEEEGN